MVELIAPGGGETGVVMGMGDESDIIWHPTGLIMRTVVHAVRLKLEVVCERHLS